MGIVTGLVITSVMGLFLPESGTVEAQTTELWRVSVGIGLIPCAITSFVFLFIYKRESLKFIMQSGDKNKEALTLLEEIYDLDDPKAYKLLLMEEERLVKHDDVDAKDSTPITRRKKETESISWSKVMCDPYYRTCTWTICLLTLVNQFTGINSINIYSQTIFENI